MRFSKSTKRTMVGCAAAVLVIVAGVPGTAHAADSTIILSDIDGRQLGYVSFSDARNTIKICDTRNDGYVVVGSVIRHGKTYVKVSDGSDAGCNTKAVSLKNGTEYLMRILRKGPGNIQAAHLITG